MSTWHQDQAMRRAVEAGQPMTFAHPTKWTTYDNPLGGMMSVCRHDTQAQAQLQADNLNKACAGNPLQRRRAYVIPPSGQGDTSSVATPRAVQ